LTGHTGKAVFLLLSNHWAESFIGASGKTGKVIHCAVEFFGKTRLEWYCFLHRSHVGNYPDRRDQQLRGKNGVCGAHREDFNSIVVETRVELANRERCTMSSFFRSLAACSGWVKRAVARKRNCSRTRLSLEQLEDRVTPALTNLTAANQLLLELVNQARLNPGAVAAHYGIGLNQGLAAGTLSSNPEAPLAPQQILLNTAVQHSNDMYTNNYFSHVSPAGLHSWQRAMANGYPTSYVGENIAWGTYNSTYDTQEEAVEELAQELFLSAPHRQNMLNSQYNEIGTGVTFGQAPYQIATQSGLGVAIGTEDFGYRAGVVYLTGVAYTDSVVANHLYDIGEGLGGITITAVNAQGQKFTAVTAPAGGYALPLAAGIYAVTASGGGLTQEITVSGVRIGSANVKLDFVPGQVSVTLPPQLAAIPNQRMSRGQTLFVALNGSDPTGATPSYSVAVSSTVAGAPSPAVTTSLSGTLLSLSPPTAFAGSFQVTVTASNGSASTSRSFVVTVVNLAPRLAPIANQQLHVSQGSLSIALQATNADNDLLHYEVIVQPYNPLYDLQQRLKLYVYNHTYFTNWRGLGEKWLRSSVDGSWYYLLPSGALYHAVGSGVLVTTLSSSVYANPALLYQARLPSAVGMTWNVTNNLLTLTGGGDNIGTFRIVVIASDGLASIRRSFLITIKS
jgi:hypothetical protein